MMTRYSTMLCLLAPMTIHSHATPADLERDLVKDTLTFPCTGIRGRDMSGEINLTRY